MFCPQPFIEFIIPNVPAIGDVIGFANRVVAFVRPERVDVHTRVGHDVGDGRLVDVGLALLVQSARTASALAWVTRRGLRVAFAASRGRFEIAGAVGCCGGN